MLYRPEQPHSRNCYYLEHLEEYEKYLLVEIWEIRAQKLKAVLEGRLTIIETEFVWGRKGLESALQCHFPGNMAQKALSSLVNEPSSAHQAQWW